MNRFVWNLQHQNGMTLPPGSYQARLTVNGASLVQPFTVLVDPRLADEGMTAADFQELYDHNLRMRQLIADVTQAVGRVREAQSKFKSAGDARGLARADAIAAKLLTAPVRYGKPGLQQHVNYLNQMLANSDQKVGRDALQRYQVLRKEMDAIKLEIDALAR
jgi:hypothetical protein